MISIQQLLIILIQIPRIHRVQIERHHRQVVEMQETTIRIRFALADDRQVFVADTELAFQIEAGSSLVTMPGSSGMGAPRQWMRCGPSWTLST